MNSRKPKLIVLGIIVSAIIILVFGCAHWTRSKKNSGATVHAQVGRPGGRVRKLPAKATTSTRVQKSKPNSCPAGSASQNLSEKASVSPFSMGPVVRVVVTVSNEPTPNPGSSFFRQQTERETQPSSSDWKHFRPQTQTGQ
jgi:hypothetical protein